MAEVNYDIYLTITEKLNENIYVKLAVSNLVLGKFSLVIRNGTPLQYSCLENPMDGGAW